MQDSVKVMDQTAIHDIEISGLAVDSRKVAPGFLFAALPGSRTDGRAYIDQAVSRGAIAVLAPPGTALKGYDRPIQLVTDDNPARDFYHRLGGEHMESWQFYRLRGDALRALAEGEP